MVEWGGLGNARLVVLILIIWLLAGRGGDKPEPSSGHEQQTTRDLQQEISRLYAEVEHLKRTRSAD